VFRGSEPGTPQENFGIERRRSAAAAEALESVREVRARIAGVRDLPEGRRLLTLDNGQVWRTTEANPAVRWRVGDELVITRGALKSFRASAVGSSRVLGVRRVE
jgi:hypothetical protein